MKTLKLPPLFAVLFVLINAASSQAAVLYFGTSGGGSGWIGNSWGSSPSGPYTSPWTAGSDAYFDPSASQTINTNGNISAGAITIGNTTTGAQTVRVQGGNTLTFNSVNFLDTANTDTFRVSNVAVSGFNVNGGGLVNFDGVAPAAINGTISVATGNATSTIGTNINFNTAGWTSNATNFVLNGSSTGGNKSAQVSFNIAGTHNIGSLSGNAITSNPNALGGLGSVTNGVNVVVNQSTNTTFTAYIALGATEASVGTLTMNGTGRLTLDAANAFYVNVNASGSRFVINNGAIVVGNTNTNTGAGDYNPITINNGGTLASDATGRTLVGSSQTVSAGAFTGGSNTNGFTVTTGGTTSKIDPTGAFAVTKLDATLGARLLIDSATDKLNLFTLTGTSGAGNFVIDLTGFSGIAANTTYSVLSWQTGTGVDLADFSAALQNGWSLNSSFGTGGFRFNGNNLELQVVPEPATWGLLAASLTVVMVLRRRRLR